MRLVRCHVENFGVLSDYDFEFATGLTTICRENGFGKSTFAAFIKAMFYGFPRTAPRNIEENERKRYAPWQGGKYGGILEFETGEVLYRVTRYFGKTAAKDEFYLWDVTHRRESADFSVNLGEDLFKLDADSFARSTYMPQLSKKDMKVTTSIRTKLSDLVDDTNDLNNYDTAEKKLRDCRTKYRAYRGEGGSIHQLERQLHELEGEKYEAEQQKPQFLEILKEVEALNREKKGKKDSLDELREKIRVASDEKARQMLQNQLKGLKADIEQNQQYLQVMDEKYPKGYPTADEIRKQRENLSTIRREEQCLKELELEEADRELVARENEWFSDEEATISDIDLCDQDCKKFGAVSAKLTAQMLPEEMNQLENLAKLFEAGMPDEKEIQSYISMADDLIDAQRQASDLEVPADSQKRLEELKELFQNGTPDEKTLNRCEQVQQECERLIVNRDASAFSQNDKKEYTVLQRKFVSGVPAEEEVQNKQKTCQRITELTAKKNTQTTIVQETPEPAIQPASKHPMIICGGIGALFLIAGIVCFAKGVYVPGVLLLVAGFVVLLGAFGLHTKQMVSNTQSRDISVIRGSAIKAEENQELQNLQDELDDFLLRFYNDASDPETKLIQLLFDRKEFEKLEEKKAWSEKEMEQINQEVEEKEQELRAIFEQYYPHEIYREGFVQELRENRHKYEELKTERENVKAQKDDLDHKINGYRSQLIAFLHPYYPLELPENLREGVRNLENEMKTYESLKAKKDAMREQNVELQKSAGELKEEIQNILKKYNALDQTLSCDLCLSKLRKRFEAYKGAAERVARYKQDYESACRRKDQSETDIREFLYKYQLSDDTWENLIDYVEEEIRGRENTEKKLRENEQSLDKFLKENPGIEKLTAIEETELTNPETLKLSEKKMQDEMDRLEETLRERRQECDRLRRVMEQIPSWEDAMARIRTELEVDKKKCEMTEHTLELLKQAKDNLANSYVGKVERGFEKYANTLFAGKLGRVIVDKELELYIDEKGINREIRSFSAGTVDALMLCMRLSLVDALFGEEKPFLILDDPFVNLDDEHTKHALEILNKIAEDHQVVYLVCNSSRQ